MVLIVKKDEPFDPMNIGFLSSRTVVSRANRLADLIEQFWFRRAVGAGTTTLRSNRFLFSGHTLALSMFSSPVADTVQSSGSTRRNAGLVEPLTWDYLKTSLSDPPPFYDTEASFY